MPKKGHSKARAQVMWASVYEEAGVTGENGLYQGQIHGENRKISLVGRGKVKIEGNVALVGGGVGAVRHIIVM